MNSFHSFNRENIKAFRFVRCGFDSQTGVASLAYAFDDGEELVETVQFPGAPFALNEQQKAAADQALKLLHLIAGVSYYKAAVPPEIRIESSTIDVSTAQFLQVLYENGLGEFAYRNGLNLRGKIKFPHTTESQTLTGAAGLKQHALVAIGGGKDSLVSIEALRTAGINQTVSWIGSSPLIKACAERTGLPLLNIERKLPLALFEINKQGALNGHIPVTAVNSAILVMAAVLNQSNQVVFSNERSASYGSIIPGTGEVNHQWSKGWAFEQAFAAQVKKYVASDLNYYSLLRPFSELAVARTFANIDRYDAHFSSCNRNFHILGDKPAQRWCGVCPKCHFVFLALAPFMPKPRLLNIFGRNLLDETEQTAGFDALMEYQDHKPFECVGEGRESRAAMNLLAASPSWREDAIVARFVREIKPALNAEELAIAPLMQADEQHGIPPSVWSVLRENF